MSAVCVKDTGRGELRYSVVYHDGHEGVQTLHSFRTLEVARRYAIDQARRRVCNVRISEGFDADIRSLGAYGKRLMGEARK